MGGVDGYEGEALFGRAARHSLPLGAVEIAPAYKVVVTASFQCRDPKVYGRVFARRELSIPIMIAAAFGKGTILLLGEKGLVVTVDKLVYVEAKHELILEVETVKVDREAFESDMYKLLKEAGFEIYTASGCWEKYQDKEVAE